VREDEEGKDWYGFRDMYNTTRQIQLNFFIDQMHDIADAPPPVPPQFVKDEKGKFIPLEGTDRKLWVNAENQRRRLKVDAIKFQTAKLAGALGHELEKGITVQGDTINILNYATNAPIDVETIEPPKLVETRTVSFLEVNK
jgi:hypothetical protein